MLTKEQIMNVNDTVIEKVSVPEWNGDVHVRSMTCADREVLSQQIEADKKTGKSCVQVRIAIISTCDKDGNRIFSDADAKVLSERSNSALQRIVAAANKINGFADAPEEPAKV